MACYLIRAGSTDKVKIGFADVVEDRRKNLQAGCWENLAVLKIWDGDRITEVWLHRQFDHLRIARDWFTFDASMLSIELPARGKEYDVDESEPLTANMECIRSKRGMSAKLARGLGITRAAVSLWQRVPAERLTEVERITGIPRHILRPDVCIELPA